MLLACTAFTAVSAYGSCQIACTTLSAGTASYYKDNYCVNLGGTFSQSTTNTVKCSANIKCSDYVTSCSDVATGINNSPSSGSSGCVGTMVDCDSSSSGCFPSVANVTLPDGSKKTMAALQIGDRVLSKGGSFQEVYMFSHRLEAIKSEFVAISTQAGQSIMLTPDHYLYVNNKLATAATVKTGDKLTTATGADDKVAAVTRTWANGLYNPHTMDGDIVVDGILTSTYTAAIQPTLAHYALWPVRMLHKLGHSVVGDAFASGSELIASLLPDGKAQY